MSLRAAFQMVTSKTPVVGVGSLMEKAWYVLISSLYTAITQGSNQPEESVPVGASPFTYQAVIRGQVFVTGGTVSAIEFSRDGTNWYPAVSPVQMSTKDFLRVTHSVAPALVVVPL